MNDSVSGAFQSGLERIKGVLKSAVGSITPSVDVDAARRQAAPIEITPKLKEKLVALQTGQVSAVALGQENDPEVVKFLQAVVGLPETGNFDKRLEEEVKKIQSSYYIDSLSGQVSASASAEAAAFISDGVVRDSIRAFIQKALDDGRITAEQSNSVSAPFDASTKNRWLFFAEPVASWQGNIPSEFLNTVAASSFAVRRAAFSGAQDGAIQARVDDIMDYVNSDENWRKLGLKGQINRLGALRIQKALETICSAECQTPYGFDYNAGSTLSNATGAYQFMPASIKLLRQHKVIDSSEFPLATTDTGRLEQDFAAIWLMGSNAKGRRVLDDIVEGKAERALPTLALEWAGLPYARDGRSYYEGDRKNHANLTWAEALMRMREGDNNTGETGYETVANPPQTARAVGI